MPETLLHTKLFVPPLRPNLVPRAHLMKRLNQGFTQGGKLTLISAPAGYGKTTLVSEWVQMMGRTTPPIAIAWLSLDENENDPIRFLAHLVTALQTIETNIGKGALSALQSSQRPSIETILTALLNEIFTTLDKVILVLDDYHAIDSEAVDEALTFLIEHLPPQMHLVIATREDPNLPLARLRVRGQLAELRITDLRFTPTEAAEFFNQAMALNLSGKDVTTLEARTEGWIAGLQLAALSLRGREDISGFIEAFAGDNRYIVDYLVEEVLQRHPEPVRGFLLQTSILDRLSSSLCDAVTREEDGREMLEILDRGNLFLVSLDDKRQWYRYHHLFADVLQALLQEEQPNQVPVLHQRASEWYEHNGLLAKAIGHTLAANDFERAADLVEIAWPEMDWSFQSATWLGWAKVLPEELVRARPVLSVGFAWALLNSGELEGGETRLNDAERWLDDPANTGEPPGTLSAGMVVVDKEQFRSLPATIASARAYYAQALGDVPGTVKYARRALGLLPEKNRLERGRLAVLLGLAYWTEGDLEAAYQSLAGAMSSFQTAGNILFAISFTFILADIRLAQGRLHDAINIYERSLQLAKEDSVLEGMGDLHLGLCELSRERGDLEAARQHLQRSEELGEQGEVYRHHWCRAQARIKKAQGDLDGALDLLDEADRWFHIRTPIPEVRPIAALKTGIWVMQGRLSEALGWAREQGLSVDDDLSYLNEFEHITLARVLIASYISNRADPLINDALKLLQRLLKTAEAGGRMGSMIEILVVRTLAHQAQGDVPLALMALENALALAEPEGYVRIFVEEGIPMKQMLLEAVARGIMPDYAGNLLARFETREQNTEGKHSQTGYESHQQLADPLSQRELEVLRLLKTELSGPEIAGELMIALSTVRTHTKSIYSKLDVNNRQTAVKRAIELDLI